MAVVVEARVLADRIAQAVGDSTDLSTVRGLETLARLCGSNATQATRELLLDVGELRLLVRRRFVPAKA